MGYRGGGGGDAAGGATAEAVAAAAAEADGDQRPMNREAACWTARSEARTMDAEPLVAAAAETESVPTTWVVV